MHTQKKQDNTKESEQDSLDFDAVCKNISSLNDFLHVKNLSNSKASAAVHYVPAAMQRQFKHIDWLRTEPDRHGDAHLRRCQSLGEGR